MYLIRQNEKLAPTIHRLVVEAPLVAQHARPGQFVIVRVNEKGERIPLTISDYRPGEGTITLIVQSVGRTTRLLARLRPGMGIQDVLGPLGQPAKIRPVQHIACVAGGVGAAIIYPEARAYKEHGSHVYTLFGARTRQLLFYQRELEEVSDLVRYATDDGSFGYHGLVTDLLTALIAERTLEHVIAVGPLPMMKAVAGVTKEAGIPTTVSLSPIMIDGTGMCGGCRVRIAGRLKFACVDGPEFDAHEVDYEDLGRRLAYYRSQEELSCRLEQEIENERTQYERGR